MQDGTVLDTDTVICDEPDLKLQHAHCTLVRAYVTRTFACRTFDCVERHMRTTQSAYLQPLSGPLGVLWHSSGKL